MKTFHFFPVLLLLVVVLMTVHSAAAQAVGRREQAPARRAQESMIGKAKAVMHDGRPSLELDGEDGWAVFILFGLHQGEPSLGFAVAQGDCQGLLYVTRSRASGDFRNAACKSFDIPRASSSAQRQFGRVVVTSGSSKYELVPQAERNGERAAIRGRGTATEFLVRAINNFDMVYRTLHRVAVEARAEAEPHATNPPAANASKQQTQSQGALAITSTPGDVQVFVDGQSRGLTDSAGSALLHLPAGSYQVRLSLPGYKDWQQAVKLAAGSTQAVAAKLEAEGPPPFSKDDVTEMLEGKMSTKRIATLVQERGVDFDLNPDLEKQLRALGGTSDLLLTIAENRKK